MTDIYLQLFLSYWPEIRSISYYHFTSLFPFDFGLIRCGKIGPKYLELVWKLLPFYT